jgi:hypothetical protein
VTATWRRNVPHRRWLVSAGAVMATLVGCSGGASPTRVPSGPFGFVAGDYTLTVYVPKGAAGEHVICVEKNDVADTVSIPVVVSVIGGGWRITPIGDANLGLVALLQLAGPTTVFGPVLGQARDPKTGVVVSISPLYSAYTPTQVDAQLEGTLASRNFAAGLVNGSVQFSVGGDARWCSPNYWILRPRS